MKRTIGQMESLLKQLQEKHGSYCRFSIRASGAPYETYIASDLIGTAHQRHNTLEEAVERLQAFVDLEDITEYNKGIAKEKLRTTLMQLEDLEDDVARYREIIDRE